MVGRQPHLPAGADDGLRHLHLAHVEVAQRAVGLDAGDADHADVDTELADEFHRGLADDASVARAHLAAGHDHLAVGVVAEDGGHVQVVGEDAQAAVVHQRAGNRLGGGADVQDQAAALGHLGGHGLGDAALGVVVQGLALAVGDVLGGAGRQPHAAVKARQQAGVGQQLHVAPHRLQRDAETLGQGLHRGRALGAHGLQHTGLAGVGVEHGGGVGAGCLLQAYGMRAGAGSG